MSVLNKIISYYPSITATRRGQDINLLKLLESDKHKELILKLRASEGEEQKQLKAKLPCYTTAGRFHRRCEEGLIEPSGLASVDLDSAEQYDQMYILKHLRKDLPCIAHAGFSCRGERLHCIVVFKFPDQYHRQYARLIRSFEEYNLAMGDQCHKTISQPRLVTWNDAEHQFFVHDAEPYDLLIPEKKFYQIRIPQTSAYTVSESPENIFAWCVEQYNKEHSFSEGTRHEYILGLARYCNIKGLSKQDTFNGCLAYTQENFEPREIERMVTHVYNTQVDSHNKIPFVPRAAHHKLLSHSKKNEVAQNSEGITKEMVTDKIQTSSVTNWNEQIAGLQSFFESITLATEPIQLNAWTKITDVAQFVKGHLATVKAQNGNQHFEPFLLRLIELKNNLLHSS